MALYCIHQVNQLRELSVNSSNDDDSSTYIVFSILLLLDNKCCMLCDMEATSRTPYINFLHFRLTKTQTDRHTDGRTDRQTCSTDRMHNNFQQHTNTHVSSSFLSREHLPGFIFTKLHHGTDHFGQSLQQTHKMPH